MNLKFIFAVSVACILLITILTNLCFALTWVIGKIAHSRIYYSAFVKANLALIILFLLVFLNGIFIGRWRIKTTNHTLCYSELPKSFDGYRIVQISDLHLAYYEGHEKQLQRLVDRINAETPDIICFTGDLVNLTSKEIDPMLPYLQQLRAKDGIYSVLGNHDALPYGHGTKSPERNKERQEIISMQQNKLLWHLLLDENCQIERNREHITIAGVRYIKGEQEHLSPISAGDLNKALTGAEGFTILLAHNPANWDESVKGKLPIALTLSGHTHAGQMRFLGWTPSSFFFKQTDGIYEHQGQYLNVNIGAGGTVPLRICAPLDITVLTLRTRESF